MGEKPSNPIWVESLYETINLQEMDFWAYN